MSEKVKAYIYDGGCYGCAYRVDDQPGEDETGEPYEVDVDAETLARWLAMQTASDHLQSELQDAYSKAEREEEEAESAKRRAEFDRGTEEARAALRKRKEEG